MPAKVTRTDEHLELDLSNCRGMEFEDAKAKIKDIPGRKFDWDRKLWLLDADPKVAERIVSVLNVENDESLVEWIKRERTNSEVELTTKLPDDAELLIPWATVRQPWQPEVVNDVEFDGLYPYQRAAVDAMAQHGRILLADDMGLGKTLQTISAIEEWRLRNKLDDGFTLPDGPRLVVCPNSVKGSWARELGRWLEDANYYIIDGTTPAKRHKQLETAIAENAWVIVNWEQLRVERKVLKTRTGTKRRVTVMKEPLFQETEWLAVVADECHRAKNRKAAQTKGLWRVQGKVMYGLSGTPLMNSPDELWAQLAWLWPNDYHERGQAHRIGARAFSTFFDQYVDYWENPNFGGKIITGVKNPDALRFELKDRLVRRTASILGLKGRKRFFYEIDLNPKQRKLYDEAKNAIWLEVKQAASEGDNESQKIADAIESGDVNALYQIPNGAARTVRLRQIIETPALLGAEDDSAILDDAVQKIMDSRPAQWIVFTEFKGTNQALKDRLTNPKRGGSKDLRVAIYNGDTPSKDRTKIEDDYQRGDIDVVVGTIAAMYQGITLTAGHDQLWVSRTWVPDINEQGEARQDRIGQQERVNVWIPTAIKTVAASKVQPTNVRKEGVVRSVVKKDEIQEEWV